MALVRPPVKRLPINLIDSLKISGQGDRGVIALPGRHPSSANWDYSARRPASAPSTTGADGSLAQSLSPPM
jgi:hypothetical protein